LPSASSVEELAAAVAAAEGPVRPRGGGTKLGWGAAPPEGAVELDTTGLDRVVEHNAGDFTAVVEAGARVAVLQARFAAHGQMLALDPPLGGGGGAAGDEGRGGAAPGGATIGGVIATADSGPLRHRYGAPRDLVLGMTVVLSDGTISRSGGKVIKNVAGYDVAKLVTGSFGTLGVIASVSLRLHPLARRHATVVAPSSEPERLAAAAVALAARPLEASCFDLRWQDGEGALLIRFDGVAAEPRAAAVAGELPGARVVVEDEEEWARQRELQRRRDGLVLKVSTPLTGLGRVLAVAAAHGGTVAARAGLGLSWVGLPAGADAAAVRRALAPAPVTVLDGARTVPDPWPQLTPGTEALMRAVKRRFDPRGVLAPGVFAGGI
jgi:glycolate oxidase FAD binding subunit